MRLKLCALLFILFSNVIIAQTCDSVSACSCIDDDLSPAGIMLGHEHPKGMWKFSYRFMNMMMQGNISGTHPVDDNVIFNNYIMSPKDMRMDMHMIMAMYGFSDNFSVMVMLNYNVLSMRMNTLPGTNHTMTGMNMGVTNSGIMSSYTQGIGDTKLYAVYKLINNGTQLLFINAGINIPTGNIYTTGKSNDLMYPNKRFPYMMQMGSGTVDFMPGISYLVKNNNFSGSVQVTSVIRPFYNSLNYRLGNELNLNAWVAYKWLNWIGTSLRVDDNYTAEIKGADGQLPLLEPSAFAYNYGGQTINSYAGVNFYLNKSFLKNSKITLEYGLPVYQNVNGVQLALTSTVYVGWMISF